MIPFFSADIHVYTLFYSYIFIIEPHQYDSIINLLVLLQRGLQQQSNSYVNIRITKSVLMGSPGVGKTSFKSLLFNWKPVLKHHSTAISTVPVRAMITSRMAEKADGEWLDIDNNPERLFHMLADAIKYLALNSQIKNDDKVLSSNVPLAKDKTSAMQAAKFYKPLVTEEQPAPSPMLSAPVPVLDPSEVQDVVDLLPKVEGVGELFDTNWIYMLDNGGQPQFADVSRAFVRANSVYFLLTKLTEKLSDRPDFCYSENGEQLAMPSKLRMTNLQLIKHFVCSIISSKYDIDVAEDESSGIALPFVSIIGTYMDEYQKGNASETIEKKNEILLQELKEFLNHFTFDNILSDSLIHPVNNLCTGSEREQASLDLHKKLLLAIQNQLKPRKVKIPVHQYFFDILVKNEIKSSGKESHGVLTLEECNDIGRKLGIDVKDTLQFFDSLNLYLYFQPLQHVVFTNPQYLLTLLSKLIQVTFVNQPSLCTNAPCVLRDIGIFDVTLLDQLNLQFVPPHFTKEHFLQLLKYTRIIASVSSTQYFLPAVLPPDELSLDEKLEFSATCDPLFVKFNCNIVPQVSTI